MIAVLRRAAAIAWAAPTTALGLLLLPAVRLGGGRVRRFAGTIEAEGGLVGRLLARGVPVRGILAFTLGHVVVARDRAAAEAWRAHEHEHVRQCERWGPLFLPAYAAASLWAWLRGGHPYRDNAFERAARAAEDAAGPPPARPNPTGTRHAAR